MSSETKGNLKQGCRIERKIVGENVRFDNLFEQEWEVFVIKKDTTTGEFIWKTACCALAEV